MTKENQEFINMKRCKKWPCFKTELYRLQWRLSLEKNLVKTIYAEGFNINQI